MPKYDDPAVTLEVLESFNDGRPYLEIGTMRGDVISKVKADIRCGVDPALYAEGEVNWSHFLCDSDTFFSLCAPRVKFGLIFIDGLHEASQCWRDIRNALSVLDEGGVIVTHDALPWCEEVQHYPCDTEGPWLGTAWKATRFLWHLSPDSVSYIERDVGFGVIRKSEELVHDMAFDSMGEMCRVMRFEEEFRVRA